MLCFGAMALSFPLLPYSFGANTSENLGLFLSSLFGEASNHTFVVRKAGDEISLCLSRDGAHSEGKSRLLQQEGRKWRIPKKSPPPQKKKKKKKPEAHN